MASHFSASHSLILRVRLDDKPGTFASLAKAIADSPFDDEALFVESLRIFLTGVRSRLDQGTVGKSLKPATA